MKNVWRKLRDSWLDFWEDDELDMDKKHLSQHDKRSLLYGGFMIGAVTFAFISISIMVGNVWTSHQNQKDMEEFLRTVVTYMATATDDEYEEIAQTSRWLHSWRGLTLKCRSALIILPDLSLYLCVTPKGAPVW